jgi:hypothetical protein
MRLFSFSIGSLLFNFICVSRDITRHFLDSGVSRALGVFDVDVVFHSVGHDGLELSERFGGTEGLS